VPFSPLAENLPESCDCCGLPGGYPELPRKRDEAGAVFPRLGLGENLHERAQCHGECGGYMVIGEALEDARLGSHGIDRLLGHATELCATAGSRWAIARHDCACEAEGAAVTEPSAEAMSFTTRPLIARRT